MSPSIAFAVWLVLLLALLRFDPARERGVSFGLWIAVGWFFILGSRLPSQWIDGDLGRVAEAMEEGNTLDRVVYLVLMASAVAVLALRPFAWRSLIARNRALAAFLAFALVSVAWSDFPFIAFKRWVRDLGTYLVILVVLSDPEPVAALRMLLRRLAVLLVPLSILLNKYFPEIAREYDVWTGRGYFIGATTSKNMLGVACLVAGIYFCWEILRRLSAPRHPAKWRILLLDGVFLAMTVVLLGQSESATSGLCLAAACMILVLAYLPFGSRNLRVLTLFLPASVAIYALFAFVFGLDLVSAVAEAVGRDSDLTGRTEIWSVLLAQGTNPWVGAGYESFWLGPRLQSIWQHFGTINEAHNGYLEVYLNLGAIGLGLLCVFLLAAYRTIRREIPASPDAGRLGLTLWIVLMIYNVTESAFRGHLLWAVFLLVAIDVAPRHARARVPATRSAPRAPAGPTADERSPEWAGPSSSSP